MAATSNPLADFVAGMDARTARALAAVERACDAGMHSVSASDGLHEFCTWYRIAAVHERGRVARAVRAVRATSPRVRLLDAAITVMAYDVQRCEQYPYIGSEVYDLRQYMYFEPQVWSPHAYDTYMRFVPVRLPMLRPYRGVRGGISALEREFADKPVVRTTELFSSLFHAVAEETMRRETEVVFGSGRDLMADMTLADYIGRGGDFTFDPEPGLRFHNVSHAIRVLAARVMDVRPGDGTRVPDSGVLTSSQEVRILAARVLGVRSGDGACVPDSVVLAPQSLFDDWAPAALDRTAEVFAAYTAAGLD